MKVLVKELLDELIQYKITHQPLKYLFTAEQKQGFEVISLLIGKVLHWHKLVIKDTLIDCNAEYLLVSPANQNHFAEFFANCNILNEIFTLKEDRIVFAVSLSAAEKQEIREYIHEHHKVEIRTMRYIK